MYISSPGLIAAWHLPDAVHHRSETIDRPALTKPTADEQWLTDQPIHFSMGAANNHTFKGNNAGLPHYKI